ncbi:MAG: hypothetical protein KAV25_04805 [Methanophagales archaeon]|nr:hypothetical protein [Methanophagales archaeon]
MKKKVVKKGEDSKRDCKLSKVIACTAVLIVSIAIAFMSLVVAPVMAQKDEVTVTVNAPECIEEGETFDVTIDVDSATDFNAGWFDLSFDHKVVKVEDVEDGSLDGTTIPVEDWSSIDSDTIKVFLNVSRDTAVSGSGYLAKIGFKVKGDEGDECVLDIENGFLGNSTAEEIPAEWVDAEIKVGTGKKGKEEESPDITAWEPMEEVVSSVEGESMTFEIIVDQTVDVSWQINGTEVKTEEDVTESSFTKSAVAGTWNVSAIATSTETGLSSMHTWIWSVTPTSTEVPEETPTSILAPGVTPTAAPTGPAVKPTVTPTAPPEEATPTPTPKPSGFEVVFAIAVLTGIAYMLLRKR